MWVERRGHPKCHYESRWTHLKYDAKEDAHYKVTEGLNRITWEYHLQNKQCSFAKSPMVIGQSFAEVMNVSPAMMVWWYKATRKRGNTHFIFAYQIGHKGCLNFIMKQSHVWPFWVNVPFKSENDHALVCADLAKEMDSHGRHFPPTISGRRERELTTAGPSTGGWRVEHWGGPLVTTWWMDGQLTTEWPAFPSLSSLVESGRIACYDHLGQHKRRSNGMINKTLVTTGNSIDKLSSFGNENNIWPQWSNQFRSNLQCDNSWCITWDRY